MSFKKIFTIYHKELKDTLRDRRTLMVMVLVPIVLYPALFAVMGQIMTLGSERLEGKVSKIACVPEAPPLLDSLLHKQDWVEIASSDDPAADLQTGEIQAYLSFTRSEEQDSVLIYFDAAVDHSRLTRQKLKTVIEDYLKQLQQQRLQAAGLDIHFLEPVGFREVNIASPAHMGGLILGFMIPILLVVTLSLGAMYPAIDLTAGEKERGTLETILTVPVQRQELVMGKFLTVATIAIITGFLNLFSMLMAYSLGIIQLGVEKGLFEFTFSPFSLLLIFFLIIPLALFISALMLSVCLFASSFKEAQNLITPLYLLLLFPALFSLAPGLELSNFLAFIPILNISLVFKEVMLGNLPGEPLFFSFLSNSVFAVLAIVMFSKLFNAEAVLFAEGKGWQFSFKRSEIIPAEVLQPSGALLTFSLLMVLLFYAASLLQLKYRLWGVLITEWVLLFLPLVFVVWYSRIDFKKALNLRGFKITDLAGTFLLALGGLLLAATIGQIQVKLFPEAARINEILEKFLNLQTQDIPLFWGLIILALSPAICEELLFRGLILSSFKKHLSPAITIGLTALLFGIFHIHIFRILPTAIIGVYLTFIVYYTGSVYLGMIAHALNNAFAVLYISIPGFPNTLGWLFREESITPPGLVLMVFSLTTGAYLIFKRRRRV